MFGSSTMLMAAAEAAAGLASPPRLLAVTVLTSLDQAQLTAIGIGSSPADHALQLAEMASANGIGGFVCSPEEAANHHEAQQFHGCLSREGCDDVLTVVRVSVHWKEPRT